MPLSKAVSEGSIMKKVAFLCEKHSEKQKLYCTECEALICALCHSVGDHKSHSVLFVDNEIGQQNKSTLKSCIVSAESSIDKVTLALAQVESSVDFLHQQSENAKEQIAQLMDHFIAIIRARQAALVGEVDQLEERADRELQRHREKLNQQFSKLMCFKLLTEDLLQHGFPKEQISLRKGVVQRIASITATLTPAPPPSCSIYFGCSAVKETCEESFSQLGSLTRGARPENCTVEDLPAPVDNGILVIQNMPLTFVVTTCDIGRQHCRGGDSMIATLSPFTCGVPVVGRVEDKGDGAYQVQFDTLPASHCRLRVTVNGGHTKGSPLVVKTRTVNDIGRIVKEFRDPGAERMFRAVAVGRDGFIFVTDKSKKEVCVFDRTGHIVSYFKVRKCNNYMDGIAETPVGNIAVTNFSNRCVKVYTANRQFDQHFGF